MKLKWGKTRVKGLSKPVLTAKKCDEWTWWALFVVFLIMAALFIAKVH